MSGPSTVHLSVLAPLRPIDACPDCGHRLPRYRRTEAWVEDPLEGGWVAAYRLIVKAGRPVVAEVRLFPDDDSPSRGPGRWSEESSAVPSEGVPGRALKALRLHVPLQRFPRFLRDIERDRTLARQLLGSHGIPLGSVVAKRRPGRAGRPDEFYLAWAVAYIQRLAAGSRRPVTDLAESPPRAIKGYVSDGDFTSPATVRDIIHEARTRGLLTEPPPGRPGGGLTPKAERLLKRRSGKPGRRS